MEFGRSLNFIFFFCFISFGSCCTMQIKNQIGELPAALNKRLLAENLDIGFENDVLMDTDDATKELIDAVNANDVTRIREALDRGANIEVRDVYQATRLFIAANDARIEGMGVLITAGANKNAKDKWGDSPIHYAASYGQDKALAALVMAGVDVQSPGGYMTPLQWATMKKHDSTVKLLRALGARC